MIQIIIVSLLLLTYLLYKKIWKQKHKPLVLFEKHEKIVLQDSKQSRLGIKHQILKNQLSNQKQQENVYLDDDYMDLIKKKFASDRRKEKDEFKEVHEYKTSGLNLRLISQSFEEQSSLMKNNFHLDKFENIVM